MRSHSSQICYISISPTVKELEELSGELGRLKNLLSLDLNNCLKLEKLPGSIGKLTNLLSLDLRVC